MYSKVCNGYNSLSSQAEDGLLYMKPKLHITKVSSSFYVSVYFLPRTRSASGGKVIGVDDHVHVYMFVD